jgi:4-amino-4-deoxy-L-arabinose transferase-like glycosyltransferase
LKVQTKVHRAKASWFSRGSLTSASAILVYLALLKLLVHLFTAGNYGYYRDELYLIAASERLDFGYVDFPTFVALVTALSRRLLGESLWALHLAPALAGTVVVVLAGVMARELGGGRFAQGMAALATFVAPTLLAVSTWLTMDVFDQLFWVSAAYVLIVILNRDRPRLWLLFGLIAGFGLLTKVTMLFFGFAVLITLLLTPARKHLRTPWPWLGGAIAFTFLLPYLYWQVKNGWPTLEFFGNYASKVYPHSVAGFLVEQVLTMQPVTLPLWLAGLGYLLFADEVRPFRVLGFVYVLLFVLFAVQDGKFYYLAPAYPMLFAAGAVMMERFAKRRRWGWLKPSYATVVAIAGAAAAPFVAVPALPVETVAKTTGAWGNLGIEAEAREAAPLPLNFADRFGWENMTAVVAGVYQGLPSEERAQACILTGNYGEAGAIGLYGNEYGLPKAISGHNNYYIWGPGGCTGEPVIAVNVPLDRLEAVFNDVQRVDTVNCEYCMPDENNLPVYIVRKPKMSLEEAWPEFKYYK